MSGRGWVDCARDPVADDWTLALWSATADLHFCRHLHRDEGAFDAAGRWRRRHLRHSLLGLPANQARAAAMAQHFCATARAAARAWGAPGLRSAFARRSFETAFAARLAARLRAALAAARAADPAYEAEARANAAFAGEGLAPAPPAEPVSLSGWDRAAVRQGRAAADNVSLVLRDRAAPAAPPRPSRNQMALPF